MARRDTKTANSQSALERLKRLVDRRLKWLTHQRRFPNEVWKDSTIRESLPWAGLVIRLIPQIESAFGAAVATKWQDDAEWLYSHAKPGVYFPDREWKFLHRIQMVLDSDLPTEDPVPSQPSKGRGRPRVYCEKKDRQIQQAWNTGSYRRYADLGEVLGLSGNYVKLAVDRGKKLPDKTGQ